MKDKLLAVFAKYEAIKAEYQKARPALMEYLKDKTQPLAERWEMYLKTPKDMLKEYDGTSPCNRWEVKYGEICWYNDFYIDRHQTRDMKEIVETMEEMLDPDSYDDNRLNLTRESIDEYKEEILENGISTFTHDW
jgi:hypothetical protein